MAEIEPVNPRAELAQLVRDLGSKKAVALKYRLDQSYLSDVMNGRRPPSDRFLKKIGLVRVVVRVKP